MSLKNERYFMSGSAQALWRDRISQALLRIGRNDREACTALLRARRKDDAEPKQKLVLALAPELSKFKAGEPSVLRRWFEDEGNRRPYLEAFAALLKEPVSIFDVWLDQSQAGEPLATDAGWHPAFPHLGSDKISIPSALIYAGQTHSPTTLATVLLPRPAKKQKSEETPNAPVKLRPRGGFPGIPDIKDFGAQAKGSKSEDESPNAVESWIMLEGQPGAGLSVAAEQLRAALAARQIALMRDGDAPLPKEVTFHVCTWQEADQLANEGTGPIVIRRRPASEPYTFAAPHVGRDESPRDEPPPNSITVEVAPWGGGQARALIEALLSHGELPEAQQVQLTRFAGRLSDDAILGPERTPQRVIALLGQVARGYAPKDATETRARLSEAAWETATRMDNSGALSYFEASLMEALWSTWLLRETTSVRYAQEHHRLDWAFIPGEKLGPLLEELTARRPAPTDPSGALKRALDQLVEARSSKERARLAEEVGRLAVAGRAEPLVHGLQQGGLLELAERISYPGARVETGWRPTDRSLVTLWAARGLERRSESWLGDGWERVMDSRWRPIIDELAALGMTWSRFSELLEACPPWAAIDVERWKIAFAAASGVDIPEKDLRPAWATTLMAVICGTHSPWVINLSRGYSDLRYAEDALALRKVSLRRRAHLPELTYFPPWALQPWAKTGIWGFAPDAPQSLSTFQEAAPDIWAQISSGQAVDGLAKLGMMIPHGLLDRIERWRSLPAETDEPESGQENFMWYLGLKDDEHGFQIWTRRAVARLVLRWLAPHQHLPWDWDGLRDGEDRPGSLEALLPTAAEAERHLKGAAEEGHPVAQWLLAGGISNNGERSHRWSSLPESVCRRWMAELPGTQELWCRTVDLGERLGKTWSITEQIGKDGKVIDESKQDLASMFRGPEYEEKSRPASPIDLDRSFLKRSKAMEDQTRHLTKNPPELAVPESEIHLLVDLYAKFPRQALAEALRDPERLSGLRIDATSWGNPFTSRLFCLRLAEAIEDRSWLAGRADASLRILNPGNFHLRLDQSWGRHLYFILPGHNIQLDFSQPWNAWPLHSILNAVVVEECWSREAASALARLGHSEALRRRWHCPEHWTPSAVLDTALLCAHLLRWWALTPPPMTPHLAVLPHSNDEDAPSRMPQSVEEALEAIDQLERCLRTIEVPEKDERSRLDTFIVSGEIVEAPLTAEQGLVLEVAFTEAEALATSIWSANPSLMTALGWMNSVALREGILQAPRLLSPFARKAVASDGRWRLRRSLAEESLPWVVPEDVRDRLPSVVRLHLFADKLTQELSLIRSLLKQDGLPTAKSPMGAWLAHLSGQLHSELWASSDEVHDWHRRMADAAFASQVRLGDLDLIRSWLNHEVDRDQDCRWIESAPGVLGTDRMRIINELVRHIPCLIDAAWGLDGLTEARLHLLANMSTSEAREHPSDHPRPWVFNYWGERLRIKVDTYIPHEIMSDLRFIPVLESQLAGLPHGRQRAKWALDLHKHRPFNQPLIEELKYWALNDKEPFRGGEAFYTWPDDVSTGESPYLWQIIRPDDPNHRADKKIGVSFGGLKFIEEYDGQPLGQVNVGGIDHLLGAFAGWCRHLASQTPDEKGAVTGDEATESLEWTKEGLKRLLEKVLKLPAIRLADGYHSGSAIRRRLTYFIVQSQVSAFWIEPLIQAAEALEMHGYLRHLYDSPPGPQPGDEECFPLDPARRSEGPIADRPALISLWLKRRLGYEPWFQPEAPSFKAPLEARYQKWLHTRPDQTMALLCMEALKLIQLFDEGGPERAQQHPLLHTVERRLVDCLCGRAATDLGSHWQKLSALEEELNNEGEVELWHALSMDWSWYPERALEILRALAPERALLVDAEVRRRHPSIGATSLIEMGEGERRGSRQWSPSLERWARGDDFPV